MMRQEVQPSKRAFEAVRRLAREAVRTDHWMVPEVDDLNDSPHEPTDDPGELVMRHREGWEQTCQFDMLWGKRIREIVDQQERRFVRGEDTLSFDDRYYGLYDPLKEEFWEEWERKQQLVEKIVAMLKGDTDAGSANTVAAGSA